MNGKCRAAKRDGQPCTLPAKGPDGYCWAHSPKNASQRRKQAARAGRSKPSREIRDLKKQLEDLAAGVLDGTVDRGNAVVVNQILNTRARLIELERKVREVEELEARLASLEERTQGGRSWRA